MPRNSASAVKALATASTNAVTLSDQPIQPLRNVARHEGQRGILAIDPGDVHIGLACGVALRDGDPGSDELVYAFEMGHTPALFAIHTAIQAGWIDLLIVEEWRLYPDKAMQQVGSEMLTAQMIGAIRWMVAHKHRWQSEVESATQAELKPQLVMQPASIQNTTKAYLRKLGIERTSVKGADHALSAELHWWKYVLGHRGLLD